MLVPSRYLLVIDYSSLITLMCRSNLDGGGGDLLSPFLGDLGWPERFGDLRYDLWYG